VTAETAGEMGPQREQTSNAYHFACEREMEPRALAYFRMALKRNLGRLGGAVASILAPAVKPLPELDQATQATLDRMEAAILARDAAEGEALPDGPSTSPGASPEKRLYPRVGIK
jgi:hypothetical protein